MCTPSPARPAPRPRGAAAASTSTASCGRSQRVSVARARSRPSRASRIAVRPLTGRVSAVTSCALPGPRVRRHTAAGCRSAERTSRRDGSGNGTASIMCPGVGVVGCREHGIHRSRLDHRPGPQDRDPIGDLVDHRQVVLTNRHANPGLLDRGEQFEHLGLHGHVESARRFVRDEQLRPKRESAGQRDPLALSTRELVREAVGEGGGQRTASRSSSTRRRRSAAEPNAVHVERLANTCADRQPGIEGGRGSAGRTPRRAAVRGDAGR